MTQAWNPAQAATTILLSNSNLTATAITTAEDSDTYGVVSVTTGRIYWEVTLTASAIANVAVGIGNVSSNASAGQFLGQGTNSAGWYGTGTVTVNGGNGGTFSAFVSGNTLCLALDLITKKLWGRVGAAGNWNNDVIANQNPSVNSQVGGLVLNAGVYAKAVVPGINLHNITLPDTAVGNFTAASWVGVPPSGFVAFDSSQAWPRAAASMFR